MKTGGVDLKYVRKFTIKFAIIATLVIFTLTPWITLPVIDGLAIALLLALALYFLGDRILFPRLGNMMATATEVVVAFLIAWLAPTLLGLPPVGIMHASVLSIVIGVAQFFIRPLFASRLPIR